jgi:outer membrane protein TolC
MKSLLRFPLIASVFFLLIAPRAHAQTISFRHAIDLALQHSTAIAAANADMTKARASLQEQRRMYIPNLIFGSGLGATYGYPMSIEGSAPTVVSVNTQSYLFNPAQQEFIRAARADVVGANVSLQDQRNQVIQETAVDYIQLDIVTTALTLLKQQEDAALQAENITQQRVDAGVDSGVELNKAKLNTARVRMDMAQSLGTADVLRLRLSQLTGLPVSAIQTDPESIPALPDLNTDPSALDTAVNSSAAVKLAQQKADAAQLRAKGERKMMYPQVDFAGQYGLFAKYNHFDEFFRKFQRNNATVGVEIRLPIFNFAGRAHAEAVDADALRAQKDAQDTKDKIATQTLQLQRTVQQFAAAKEVTRLEHELAISDVDAVQAKVQAGTASVRDQDTARLVEHQKYSAYLDSSFQYDKAAIQLLYATGELEKWALSAHE